MGDVTLSFRPVTPARWGDFEALFESRGGPSYCWCMAFRTTSEEVRAYEGRSRKPLIEGRVKRRVPIGLLGYHEGTPVAWVSIAPRETYQRLGGMPEKPGENVWSLACMFVRRDLRGAGLAHQLIAAAADYAGKRGADVLEAYPVDPDSPSYRFMGFVPAFERAGFALAKRAGTRRHVMRLPLSGESGRKS